MPPRTEERPNINNQTQSHRKMNSSQLSHKNYKEDQERGRPRNAGTTIKQTGSRSNSNGATNTNMGSKQYSVAEKVQMLSEKIQSRLALSRDSRQSEQNQSKSRSRSKEPSGVGSVGIRTGAEANILHNSGLASPMGSRLEQNHLMNQPQILKIPNDYSETAAFQPSDQQL